MNELTKNGTEAKTVTSATANGKIANTKETPGTPKATIQERKEELKKILEPVSAEQRIKNAENFQKLAEKHKFLTEKADDLNSFMIGAMD